MVNPIYYIESFGHVNLKYIVFIGDIRPYTLNDSNKHCFNRYYFDFECSNEPSLKKVVFEGKDPIKQVYEELLNQWKFYHGQFG